MYSRKSSSYVENMTYKQLREEMKSRDIPNRAYSKKKMIELLSVEKSGRSSGAELSDQEVRKLYPPVIKVDPTRLSMEDAEDRMKDEDMSLTDSIEKIFSTETGQSIAIPIKKVFRMMAIYKNISARLEDFSFLKEVTTRFGEKTLSYVNCKDNTSLTSKDVKNALLQYFLDIYQTESRFFVNKSYKETRLTVGGVSYTTPNVVEKSEEKEELTNLLPENRLYGQMKLSISDSLKSGLTFLKPQHFPSLFANKKCCFSKEGKIALLSILDSLCLSILERAKKINDESEFKSADMGRFKFASALNTDECLSMFFEI